LNITVGIYLENIFVQTKNIPDWPGQMTQAAYPLLNQVKVSGNYFSGATP
jgi:hypothetical protein